VVMFCSSSTISRGDYFYASVERQAESVQIVGITDSNLIRSNGVGFTKSRVAEPFVGATQTFNAQGDARCSVA